MDQKPEIYLIINILKSLEIPIIPMHCLGSSAQIKLVFIIKSLGFNYAGLFSLINQWVHLSFYDTLVKVPRLLLPLLLAISFFKNMFTLFI